jgi:hypothetical protein
MLEKPIEARLKSRIADVLHGTAYKFTSPQRRSVPDRLCLLPGGVVFFVECKATGKKPTPAQLGEHRRLRGLDFLVFIVDSYEDVDLIVDVYS